MEFQLRDSLTPFLRQDHPNYEVVFVVEDQKDPATQLIRNLINENRCVQARIVVAGRAQASSQKIHNLRQVISNLPPEFKILVFADSSARPSTSWLRWLVHGVGREGLGARTGFRWALPRDTGLPSLIACTANNSLASMLGRGKHYLVWSGSWAIHRHVFDAVGIADAWTGVLSDDLVASRALAAANLAVEFEPQSMCTTHIKMNYRHLFRYLHRQSLLGRRYAPRYWWPAFGLVVTSQLGFWAAIGLGGYLLAQGQAVIAALVLALPVLLYGLGIWRALIRKSMGKLSSPQWRSFKAAKNWDIFAGPITGLVLMGSMLASLIGRQVVWPNSRYIVARDGRVSLVGHKMQPHEWPRHWQGGHCQEAEIDTIRLYDDDHSHKAAA